MSVQSNFHIPMNFPVFLLILVSSFILLESEKIATFLNFLRLEIQQCLFTETQQSLSLLSTLLVTVSFSILLYFKIPRKLILSFICSFNGCFNGNTNSQQSLLNHFCDVTHFPCLSYRYLLYDFLQKPSLSTSASQL